MTTRLMIPGLSHKYPGYKNSDFFKELDKTAGWPPGFKYVGFEHTDERAVGFCDSPHNDGWWTVFANSDDYYIWKLSPEAVEKIVTAVLNRSAGIMRNLQLDVSKLSIHSTWSGFVELRKKED